VKPEGQVRKTVLSPQVEQEGKQEEGGGEKLTRQVDLLHFIEQ